MSGRALPGVLSFSARALELKAMGGDPAFGWVFEREFEVSPRSDRVGVRLVGGSIRHELELPSRPATIGTVQVTPSGELIVFGPDGPTIGGYPQAATLVSASLPDVARLRPGDRVRLRRIE
jgi:allophanate hydrolase subunit 2